MKPILLVLVLVLDLSSWFRGRGRGQGREGLVSWHQLTSEFWRCSLPMNLRYCRQVLDCASPLALFDGQVTDSTAPEDWRTPRRCRAISRSVAVHGPNSRPIFGGVRFP